MTETDVEIVDNPAESRFEARLDGRVVGFSEYELEDRTITFHHTETDERFEGRGFGSKLAAGALDAVRVRDLQVVSRCPFITAYIRRHAEYRDLLTLR